MSPVDNYVDKVGKSLWLVRFLLGISCGFRHLNLKKIPDYQAKYCSWAVGEN
jgi:hypothetical protein